MNTMKKWSVLGLTALSLFLFAGIASAHVTVQPPTVEQNSYQVFAVRVPSEKENVTTTTVKVKVADGVKVSRVEPKDGWKYELERDASTKAITAITWTAEGAGLAQTEFTDFRISGKVAEDAKQLVWKAYQTYSDKSVVEWVGGDGAEYPASVTTVTAAAAGAGDNGHGGGTASEPAGGKDAATSSEGSTGTANAGNIVSSDTSAPAQETAQQTTADEDSTKSNVTLGLAIAAVVLAGASLVVSATRKKR
ncbi:uncharacterized protein YcnI [Paenibacillus taihuensis]|uniref:Uncharacterized protein YcnI n=1 Tax=Paenibacillus taihuensis TaxID=1156355 RepID=A0A3D9RZ06_9BACL|nr:YcnI family protein [Paenibacillus taihuensis]REE85097.1 uncharacterized protein YcnI [Paenibacillus taihuensis]